MLRRLVSAYGFTGASMPLTPAHDKALKGGFVGLKAAEPFACALHALNRSIDRRVAVGVERRLALAGCAESAAVRTALHANLVPQVVVKSALAATAQAPVTSMPRRRGSHARAAKQMSLGITKASWRSRRRRHHERVAAGIGAVASAQPQIALASQYALKSSSLPVKLAMQPSATKMRSASLASLARRSSSRSSKWSSRSRRNRVEVHAESCSRTTAEGEL